MNSLDESLRGPSFWKFNSNLVNDSDYGQLISANYNVWLEEFQEVLDKRVLWDLVKYRIRQCAIEYSKSKARERKEKLQEVEECIKECSHKCDKDLSSQNLEELESLEAEYENLYDFSTQGAIIRSCATWYEMGERNNKYFLNLENSNKKKTSVRKVFTSEGSLTHNTKKIMNDLESYYSSLYDGNSCANSDTISTFISKSNQIPKVPENLRNICEGKLGYGECYNVLKSFQKNKSPVNDGLTVEFYIAFWHLIGALLVDSLNYAFEYGELSNSQKQAIITLIKKKGKDKRLIKNWPPISLTNVDAKIASKALAKRLEKTLPEIIHYNQNAFVKGRTIFDAIRTIEDVIEHTKQKGLSGILVADDFKKAFDTLNFNYFIRILQEFNFGPSFIQWICVLYKNASSCVMNNGFSTGPFSLGGGVRQGDPLSAYLFIIALEVLAIRIRNSDSIQGFKIGEVNVKLNLFADDMTCFPKDKRSYTSLFRLLYNFGECSGLKVNHEKTEALAFGDSSIWEDLSNMHNLRNVIKILGIYFGSNDKERDDINFRETLKSIKKSLNLWKWRGLSLLGRIQIVKTFAFAKFMFRASALPISKELIKNANSNFFNFIWNGKDKVKRNVLTSTIESGGLNMLDIDSMIRAKRVSCFKKYLEDYPSPWKFFLDERLLPVGGKLYFIAISILPS